MKKIYKLWVKLLAGIVLCIMSVIMATGVASTIFAYEMDFYDNVPREFMDTEFCSKITNEYIYEDLLTYLRWYIEDEDTLNRTYYLEKYKEKFAPENSNLKFAFMDSKENILLSNCNGVIPTNVLVIEETISKVKSSASSDNNYKLENYRIKAYIDEEIQAKDEYYDMYRLYRTVYSVRIVGIVIAAVSGLIALLLLIFLACSAGKDSNGDIKLRVIDKIPYDIALVALIVLAGSATELAIDILRSITSVVFVLLIIYGVTIIYTLVICHLVMSAAILIKKHELIKRTLIYRILHIIYIMLKTVISGIADVFRNIAVLWRTVILLLFTGIILLILLAESGLGVLNGIGTVILIVYLGASIVICGIIIQFNTVKKGGEQMAKGDFTCRIPVNGISTDIKKLAINLNGINESLSMAVEERMKSERMKAELITNVSHDIKTPLTSIINYVDLLRKENIENEAAVGYIEVLDRQSAKLKKLINDLVEASKASTGNIQCTLVRMNISEFINQSVAEYAEKFTLGGLTPIINAPGEAMIMADGKLLWRVFDNLLGNVCKYSQSDTRVYIDVIEVLEYVDIYIKNISKESLSISPEELMQRFVRGDSARSTEGSGLGLSIAQSLTELQGGEFGIDIDGDLFKIKIRLSKCLEHNDKE